MAGSTRSSVEATPGEQVIEFGPIFNVEVASLKYYAKLVDSVREMLAVVDTVEKNRVIDASPLVTFVESSQLKFGIDGVVTVPNVSNQELMKRGMDMEMLINYINLQVDHAYFFRDPEKPEEFSEEGKAQVLKIVGALTGVFAAFEAGATNGVPVKVSEALIKGIADRISTMYVPGCAQMFTLGSNSGQGQVPDTQESQKRTCTTSVATLLRDTFGLVDGATIPQATLTVLVHYILSRILIARIELLNLTLNRTQTPNTTFNKKMEELLRAIKDKKNVVARAVVSPSATQAPAATNNTTL